MLSKRFEALRRHLCELNSTIGFADQELLVCVDHCPIPEILLRPENFPGLEFDTLQIGRRDVVATINHVSVIVDDNRRAIL